MTNRAFRLPDNNGSPFTNYHAKRPGQYWIDQASGEVVREAGLRSDGELVQASVEPGADDFLF